MTIEALIVWLVIGAIAGWLVDLIGESYGFGLIGNIAVGIVGAVIAGWLLPRIGFVFVGGIVAAIINAVIGNDSLARNRVLQEGVLRHAVIASFSGPQDAVQGKFRMLMSLEDGTGHLRREKGQQDKASDIALVGVIGPCQDPDWPVPLVQEIAPPTLREALRRIASAGWRPEKSGSS